MLKAIFIVNITDDLLNMSDLTNCVSAVVIDPKDVSKEIIESAIFELSTYYNNESFSLLIYPEDIAVQNNMSFQKKYVLWITDSGCSDPYFEYLNQIISQISKPHKN